MQTLKVDYIIEAKLRQANEKLAKRFDADVLMINAPMHPPVDDIIRFEVENIKDRAESNKDKLTVIVETGGGSVEVVERIVSVFRRHYGIVEFVVPNFAYSAGTVLVLSGDEIYMDYYSVLGPIDPQFRNEQGEFVPGMGYLAKYKELIDEINRERKSGEAEPRAEMAYLLKKFDAGKLFNIEQAMEHSKSLLEDWLPKYKFKDWKETKTTRRAVTDKMKSDRAREIANILGNAEHWHSHGRGISRKELASENIKLQVVDFGADSSLNELVRDYYGLFSDYTEKMNMQAALHTSQGIRRLA